MLWKYQFPILASSTSFCVSKVRETNLIPPFLVCRHVWKAQHLHCWADAERQHASQRVKGNFYQYQEHLKFVCILFSSTLNNFRSQITGGSDQSALVSSGNTGVLRHALILHINISIQQSLDMHPYSWRRETKGERWREGSRGSEDAGRGVLEEVDVKKLDGSLFHLGAIVRHDAASPPGTCYAMILFLCGVFTLNAVGIFNHHWKVEGLLLDNWPRNM